MIFSSAGLFFQLLGMFSSFVIIFLFLFSVKCSEDHGDEGKLRYSPEFNARNPEKWKHYLDLIQSANIEFSMEVHNNNTCEVFVPLIDDDLSYFENRFGRQFVDEDVIERTIKSKRAIHYQIVDKRLYREEKCTFPARCEGIEHFIRKSLPELPNMDLFINVRDYPQVGKYFDSQNQFPIFSFSKDTKDYCDITYPAWTYWSGGPALDIYPTGIGRWDLQRESLIREQSKLPWSKKESKAFFRGSRTSSERDPIILLGRKREDIVDSKYTKNQAWKSPKDTLGDEPAKTATFEEHCQYKILFNARGVAASFRLKHLFLCRSLVVDVSSNWIEFFYPPLKPWIHYVPIDKDMKNAEKLLEFLLENDDISSHIAKRGYDFVRKHLTMDCIQYYWNVLLNKYSQRLIQYRPARPDDDLIDITDK